MDLSTLATNVLAAMTPYLVKGGEQIATGMGKDLWELIKKPFTSEKDAALITKLEAEPGDAKTQGKVELRLEEMLEADPGLAAELRGILERIGGGTVSVIQAGPVSVTGEGSVGIGVSSHSTITINRK